jgi:inosine-uridine nucleoside N-ribohydrolase
MTIWDLNYSRRARVILDTDAKNEADDQFAVVHALLSPSLDVRGLVPAHFGPWRGPNSMQESRSEVDLLLGLLGMDGKIAVANGAPHELPDISTPVPSDGASRIINEAMKDEPTPLFVAFLGPLTDMASALLIEPRIAQRDVTVIWIGGLPYGPPGAGKGREFNLSNDIVAANVVFASSVRLWQVPSNVYGTMAIGYAELYEEVSPCGEIGSYLVRQLVEFSEKFHTERSIEFWSLGDSPAVGLILNQAAGAWVERPAPGFNNDCSYDLSQEHRPIRVYNSIDSRFILSDMCAKLRAFQRVKTGPGRATN